MSRTCDFAANWARFDAESAQRAEEARLREAEIRRLYALLAGNDEEYRLQKLTDLLAYRLCVGPVPKETWEPKVMSQIRSAVSAYRHRGALLDALAEAAKYRFNSDLPPGWGYDGGSLKWEYDGLTICANYSPNYWSYRAEGGGFHMSGHGGPGWPEDDDYDDDEEPETIGRYGVLKSAAEMAYTAYLRSKSDDETSTGASK